MGSASVNDLGIGCRLEQRFDSKNRGGLLAAVCISHFANGILDTALFAANSAVLTSPFPWPAFRMGNIFPLIADGALRAEDPSYYTECQVCGKPQVPVYECQGNLARSDGTADD